MPGGTAKYALPYLLNTEGLYTIGNVTRLLAERLEALIDNGTLKGGKGDTGTPGGPQGPAASILQSTAYSAGNKSLQYAFAATPETEYDVRGPNSTKHVVAGSYGLTVRLAGIYHVTAQVPWATNNATGHRVVKLVDATGGANNTVAEDVRPGTATDLEQISQLSVVMPLTAGQLLQIWTYQTSGAALNVAGTQQGGIRTRFTLSYLGATS